MIDPDKYTVIVHKALPGIRLFPTGEFIERFLDRLAKIKRLHGIGVHAYGISPTTVRLIIMPNDNIDLDIPLRGLFTSPAKLWRNAFGGSGPVFDGKFGSKVLDTESDLEEAIERLVANTKAETGDAYAGMSYFATDWRKDKLQICDDPSVNNRIWMDTGHTIIKKFGSYPTATYYREAGEVVLKPRSNELRRKRMKRYRSKTS